MKITTIGIDLAKEVLKCSVKNGVHRFKWQADWHSIAVKIVQAINILIFLACAVGYRRFRTIR